MSEPKFAWTNHTSCCVLGGGNAFWMIQLRLGVCVWLFHICVGVVIFTLLGSYFSAARHTHAFLHIANVLEILMLLEILARLLPHLPRINPSASRVLMRIHVTFGNSWGAAECLAIIPFHSFQLPVSIRLRGTKFKFCNGNRTFKKRERKKTPTKQENALNPAVLALQFNRAPALFR